MEGTQKYEGCDGTTSPHSQPSVDSMLLTPTSAASHSPSESRCYTVLSSLQAAFAFVVFSKICHVHRSRVTEMKQRKEGSQPSGVQPPLTRTTTAFFSWMHPCCSNVLANSINREHYCMYSRAVCFRVLCPVDRSRLLLILILIPPHLLMLVLLRILDTWVSTCASTSSSIRQVPARTGTWTSLSTFPPQLYEYFS